MTSVVIPGLDLVPSLPSRVVTVDLVDMTEGVAVAGAKIDFFLPADLHVPADDKILQAGRVTVTLNASGHGEIRLPAYTDTVRPADWVIGVKKHWAPHPYFIRVPAGSTKISLADIDAVHKLPPDVLSWIITGVSLTMREGAVMDGTAKISGGILDLDLTFPPGGTAYWLGSQTLTANDDINSLGTGVYAVWGTQHAIDLGMPTSTPGVLEVWDFGTSTVQEWRSRPGGVINRSQTWRRHRSGTQWSPWDRVDSLVAPLKGRVGPGRDFETVADAPTGWASVDSSAEAADLDLPIARAGLLKTIKMASVIVQEYTATGPSGLVSMWARQGQPSTGTFLPWVHIGGYNPNGDDPDDDVASVPTASAVLWGSSSMALATTAIRAALRPYGVQVHNNAKGGQWSSQTEISVGSKTWTFNVQGGTIPATGPVTITPVEALKRDGSALFPTFGWLAGVHGKITGEGGRENSIHTFTRTRPGKAVSAGGVVNFDTDVRTYGELHIIGAGKNDLNVAATLEALDEVIERRDRMVAHWVAAGMDFLVVGHFINAGTPADADRRLRIDQDNADAATKYPDNFLSMKAMFDGPDAWDWAGIDPTQADLDALTAGTIPPSFASGNHLNTLGNEWLAESIRRWATTRGLIGAGRAPLLLRQ